MRALQFERYGGILEALRFRSVDTPRFAPDEVLIEIHAVSAGTFDVFLLQGVYSYFFRKKYPSTIGLEFSGVVVAKGDKVTNFDIGSAVIATIKPSEQNGGFSEFIAISENLVRNKPRNWSFAKAALLPVSYRAIYQALIDTVGIQTGYKVLLHGATSGLGSITVQLCKAHHCVVAATCYPEQKEFLRKLGVDVLIDSTHEHFRTFIKEYDVVVNLEGSSKLAESIFCIKKGGVLLSISGPVDSEKNYIWDVAILKRILNKLRYISFFRNLRQQQIHYRFILPPKDEMCFDEVLQYVEHNELQPIIEHEYPNERSIEALEYVHRNKNLGNIVVLFK